MSRDPLALTRLSLLLAAALAASAALAQEGGEAGGEPAPLVDDEAIDDADILVPAGEDEGPPAAATRPKIGMAILVPVGDADKPLAEQVSKSLLSEMSEARFEVVPIELGEGGDEAREIDADQGQRELKRAQKYLRRGKGLLKDLRFNRAEKAFDKAAAELKAAAPALESMEPILDLHLGRAEMFARQGLEEQTRPALADAVRADPEHQLDPAKFPPLFIRTHAEVREEVMAGPQGGLVVDATGRGARVFIDGREMGEAPLEVTGLPAGEHYVRVFQDEVGLFGTVATVEEGGKTELSPGFFEAGGVAPEDLLAQNRFDDEAAQKVAEKAKAQELVGAIVGVVAKDRTSVPTALIYVDAASGMVRHVDVMNFDGDLLNMAIEALEGKEEIEKAMAEKAFARVDDEPLLEGVKGAADLEVPTVAMRYEVPDAPAAKEEGRSRRRLGGGGDEGDDSSRQLASSGSSGRRKSLRDGMDSGDPLTRRERRSELVEEEDPSFLTNPWLWTGVGIGAAAAVAVVAAGGGAAAYVLFLPPTQAQVTVNLPEE